MHIRRLLPIVVFPFLLTACWPFSSSDNHALVPPPKVPVELVPASLEGGELALFEYPEAKKNFASAGDKSLVADGRLWEVRRGARLVGTLQVSTLRNKVDLTDAKVRSAIINQIIPGVSTRLSVDEVEVFASVTPDKLSYLWFGDRMFQLLHLKASEGTQVDGDAVVEELIAFQKPSGKLEAPARKSSETSSNSDEDDW